MADTALTALAAASALDADDLFYAVEDGTSVKATGTQVATLMAGIIAPGDIGAAADGAVTASGLTMATARLLGRTTASTGAVEEITVGAGLSLSAGALTATGGAVDADDVTYTPTTLADWDSSADPGDVEQALDQLAERVTDVETGTFQPLDSDLTTIAGLTATTDNFIQSKSSAWASRTVAQVNVDLQGTGLVTDSAGFRTVPSNSQSTAYTTVAADSGKSVDHPSSDANARTFTIDSNANVAYPVGTCLSFSNMTSQAVTIAITSDTMYLAGTGTTGSRTLAQYGTATARKLTSTTWLISGVGLT
jgi:hypothetical protein